MAGQVQLFAKNSSGETCILQLSSYEPIKMTISIAEQNPFVPTSAYSQTFRIPGQGSNVAFFEDVYSVNGSSFDAGKAAEAWILSDGFLFAVGNLTLKSVVRNEKYSRIEYEVFFLGDTADFVTAVGDDFMNQINTSEINHSLTYANVTGSWAATGGATAGLKNGNVLYPLCEWGYTYDSANFPTLNTISNSYPKGSTGYYGGSFTRGTTGGLLLTQMKPATRVKWIWDKIFEQAGYTYESEFLDQQFFSAIYMLSDSIERPEQQIQAGLCNIATQGDQACRVGESTILRLAYKRADLDNVFNTETYSWRCPSTGTYSFSLNGYGYIGRGSPVPQGTFRVVIKKNGTPILTSGIYVTSTTSSPYYNVYAQESITVPLVTDDIINVHLETLPFSNSQLLFTRWTFRCTAAADEVIVSSFFPGEGSLRKIDFIKGITKAFNLVWEPSRDSQKKFIIEPWVDWVRGGEEKDWTPYLDGSKDLVQIPAFLSQSKILRFTGEQDLDLQNEIFQKQYKESYLFRQYNSKIDIITGSTEIKIPFAGTPLQSLPVKGTNTQYPNWIVPTVAKLTTGNSDEPQSGKVQPIRPRPRLLFYNGLVPQDGPNWYLMNDSLGLTGTAQTKYPLVSEFLSVDGLSATIVTQFPNNNESFNLALNFQTKPPLWSPDVEPALQTASIIQTPDLYTTYWDEFVDWLYDPFNRKVTAYFRLDAKQIQELSFNDKIWVKDSWYLVEKIYDYPVGEIANVKVDLIKCPPLAIPLTSIAATGPTSGTCKAVTLCYTALLTETPVSYTYVDCNSNLQAISLNPMACGKVCMLYPPNNPLPPGWTAVESGGCSGPNQEFVDEGGLVEFVLSATGATAWTPNTNVAIYASADGPTGTFLPMQYYLWSSMDDLDLSLNVPYGYWVRVEQEEFDSATGAATGGTGYFQEVSLYINGATAATQTQTTYSPIVLDFTGPIDIGGTYGATAAIQYPPLPPS